MTEQCLKTNNTGNCICKLPEGHEGLCKCGSCGQEFQGEPSTDTQNREQKRSAERCAGCPLLLSDAEVSLVENAIGKSAIWMFNKVWEERNNVIAWVEKAKTIHETCRKEKRVEVKYWEFKQTEMLNVIELQTKTLDSIVESLRGKIKPRLFNKITTYVQQKKESLPKS